MILSFSSLEAGATSTTLALGLPSLVALLAYAVAAALREGALGSASTGDAEPNDRIMRTVY